MALRKQPPAPSTALAAPEMAHHPQNHQSHIYSPKPTRSQQLAAHPVSTLIYPSPLPQNAQGFTVKVQQRYMEQPYAPRQTNQSAYDIPQPPQNVSSSQRISQLQSLQCQSRPLPQLVIPQSSYSSSRYPRLQPKPQPQPQHHLQHVQCQLRQQDQQHHGYQHYQQYYHQQGRDQISRHAEGYSRCHPYPLTPYPFNPASAGTQQPGAPSRTQYSVQEIPPYKPTPAPEYKPRAAAVDAEKVEEAEDKDEEEEERSRTRRCCGTFGECLLLTLCCPVVVCGKLLV